ncbi:membrane protein [Gordonia phage RavenCo17]|nr:membrane protein [Gordonia phage RavenCo17]
MTRSSSRLYSLNCKNNTKYREGVKRMDKVDLALVIATVSAILQAVTVWQNRNRE